MPKNSSNAGASNAIGKAGFRSGPYTQNKGGYSGLPCGYTGYGANIGSDPNRPIRTHQSRLGRTAKGGQPVQRHKHVR